MKNIRDMLANSYSRGKNVKETLELNKDRFKGYEIEDFLKTLGNYELVGSKGEVKSLSDALQEDSEADKLGKETNLLPATLRKRATSILKYPSANVEKKTLLGG